MQIKHAKLNSDLLIVFESIVMKFNDTNRWSPKKWCEQREIHIDFYKKYFYKTL